jgi:histidinol phosphatase-like enzyme
MHAKMHDLVMRAGGHIDYVVFCPHGAANRSRACSLRSQHISTPRLLASR